MYVTRPLSLYKRNPQGSELGFTALQDDEPSTRCFVLCKDTLTTDFIPFPQNKHLAIEHRLHATLYTCSSYPLSTTTNKRNIVPGDVVAPIQRVAVYEKEIRANDGFGGKDWFRPVDYDGLEARIGVSLQLVERMKWEQETFAHADQDDTYAGEIGELNSVQNI
ncbi:hypothetical protein Cgig2_025118 [Carnegiea gigantea]|uniref:Uncharacterized protein n=1 Tax=Carnegiea gigantea TaxID=171969 RepID=A0A9Q1KSQ8_9CARY|nr:hypothetical protein Cgig2_025118 [Carnegiea gigantea]